MIKIKKHTAQLNFERDSEFYDLSLTDRQLKTIFKILGFRFDTDEKHVYSYSDEMLKRFNSESFTENPLHHKLVDFTIIDETGD